MVDQYRYVGPVLLVLRTMPDKAQLVRHVPSGKHVEPKEVWIEILTSWVRLDGEWISGWDNSKRVAFRPNWLNRWKLRRAGRRWLKETQNAPR